MRHVETLDAQGCIRQFEGITQLQQRPTACIVIARALQPRPLKVFTRVDLDGLEQILLRTSRWNTYFHRSSRPRRQPCREFLAGCRHVRGQDEGRNPQRWIVLIQPFDDAFHQSLGAGLLHLVHDMGVASHDPSVTNVEELHGGLQFIVDDADKIEVFV